jgi:hypothetical protein
MDNNKIHWTDALIKLEACYAAVEWASTKPDLATAWRECKRGDWMLWLLGKTDRSEPWSEGRKPLVRCALECAAEAAPYEGDGEAGRAAAECRRTVLAWTRGEATREEVNAARGAAANAANAANAYSAVYAAYAAYGAAYAAYGAAANAVFAATYAADAYAEGVYETTYSVASAGTDTAYADHDRVLARCADIVREHYPDPPAIDVGGSKISVVK